jgi:AcrR family transcriptional regulator
MEEGVHMKKMDIRTKFTKRALKDSLLELMKTIPIRDIPIKAICAGAEVSRSTFYIYYDDQYDLLTDIQNETFDKVKAEYRKYLLEPGRRKDSNVYEEWLRHVADNQDSLQVLLSENGDINFQKKLIEERIMEIGNELKRINESADEETQRVYSVFLVQGLLGLIQDWIKHGMDIPIPKMAKVCNRLMNSILR